MTVSGQHTVEDRQNVTWRNSARSPDVEKYPRLFCSVISGVLQNNSCSLSHSCKILIVNTIVGCLAFAASTPILCQPCREYQIIPFSLNSRKSPYLLPSLSKWSEMCATSHHDKPNSPQSLENSIASSLAAAFLSL